MAVSAQIDAVKAERRELGLQLDASKKACLELRTMGKVVAVSAKTGVDTSEIVERNISVEESSIGRIIGRGGSSLKAMEDRFGVGIDIDDKSSSTPKITVCGRADSVEDCLRAIEEIDGEEEKNVRLARGLVSFLINNSGEQVNRLEAEHGCRIRLDRDASTALVRGGSRAVNDALEALGEYETGHFAVDVEGSLLPALIGKKGANFRKIQDETFASVDAVRHGDEATITVYGEQSSVEAARLMLEALISENREHEERVPIDPDMSSFLIANKAQRIRDFQSENGVYMLLRSGDADEDARTASETKSSIVGEFAWPEAGTADVIMRGKTASLRKALVELNELRKLFERLHFKLKINSAQARALIGDKGSVISKIRTTTGAFIDVHEPERERRGDDASGAAGGAGGSRGRRGRPRSAAAAALQPGEALVVIRADTDTALAAAKAEVMGIISSVVEDRLELNDAAISALIGTGGKTVQELQSESGASINIARERDESGRRRGSGIVTISGTRTSVAAARTKIDEIAAANVEESVPLANADLVGSLVGKGGENIRKVEEESGGASITVDKSHLLVHCRGTAAQAAAAATAVRELLDRAERENFTLNVDVDAMPLLIGKKGSVIRSIEEETGASIDAQGKTGVVRIRGPEEAIARAVARVRELTGADAAAREEVPVQEDQIGPLLGRGGANLTKIQNAHGVIATLNRPASCVVLRGSVENVAAAAAAVRKALRDAIFVEQTVSLRANQMGDVFGRNGARLRQLQADSGAMVDVPPRKGGRGGADEVVVTVRGGVHAVLRAVTVLEAIARGELAYYLSLGEAITTALGDRAEGQLRRIESERHVTMRAHPDGTCIAVVGSKAAVAAAVRDLEEVVLFMFPAALVRVDVPGTLATQLAGESAASARTRKTRGGAGAAAAPAAATADADADADAAAPAPAVELEEGEIPEGEAAEAAAAAATAAAATPAAVETLTTLNERFNTTAALSPDQSYVIVTAEDGGDIEGAAARLQEMAGEHAGRSAEVSIGAWAIPALVGKKGVNIKKLRADTGAEIDIQRGGDRATVVITGATPEIVEAGRAAVDAVAERMGRFCEVVSVTSRGIGIVIGKGGSTVRRIQEETKASLDVVRDSNTVSIKGSEEAVAAAREEISKLLEEAGIGRPEDVTEVVVRCRDRNVAMAVVGRGGETVEAIQSESGANVRVERVSVRAALPSALPSRRPGPRPGLALTCTV